MLLAETGPRYPFTTIGENQGAFEQVAPKPGREPRPTSGSSYTPFELETGTVTLRSSNLALGTSNEAALQLEGSFWRPVRRPYLNGEFYTHSIIAFRTVVLLLLFGHAQLR